MGLLSKDVSEDRNMEGQEGDLFLCSMMASALSEQLTTLQRWNKNIYKEWIVTRKSSFVQGL